MKHTNLLHTTINDINTLETTNEDVSITMIIGAGISAIPSLQDEPLDQI